MVYPFSCKERALIFKVPFFLVALFSVIYLKFPEFYLKIIREDSLVEVIQAILYLASSLIGLWTAHVLYKCNERVSFLLIVMFSLGCFFIFGEEISWGQRIFDFSTPESISAINMQKEFTVHNLYFIQSYTIYLYFAIALYVCLSWIILRKYEGRVSSFWKYVALGWEMLAYYLLIAVFYAVHLALLLTREDTRVEPYLVWPMVENWRHQESFELIFALGFLILAYRNLLYAKADSLQRKLYDSGLTRTA